VTSSFFAVSIAAVGDLDDMNAELIVLDGIDDPVALKRQDEGEAAAGACWFLISHLSG
jgi:hypothetical protein